MILNNFRKIDLVWNNAYEKLGNVRTAQYDEKGRKLVVQVTDGGDIVDLTGAELKLVTVDGLEYENRNLLPTNPNLYTTGTYIHYKFQDKPMEYLATLEDRDTEVDMSGVFISIDTQGNPNGAASVQWFMRNGVEVARERKGKNELYFSVYPRTVETLKKVFDRYYIKVERGDTKATDWTPAPEDLQFPFDLIDAQKGIYELYFPKLFVDRYTGDTKVFLELTTKDFSVTSEPFYINVFEGVR